jgi:serine/threonine protein kinase
VYKALHKQSGNIVAIKVVPINNDFTSLQKEIAILKKCMSMFVVAYYGSYLKENDLWLIMEYCNAGSVIDLIKITKRTLKNTCTIPRKFTETLKQETFFWTIKVMQN